MSVTNSILVVDDESALVQLCELIFRDAGFAVRGATSGRQALRMIAEDQPDIVLLDVMMPGMNGIEVCRQIRASCGQQPHILMYTADDQESTRRNSLEAGANGVLTKMTPVFELPQHVTGMLSGTDVKPKRARYSLYD